jgi:hypothetical protein
MIARYLGSCRTAKAMAALLKLFTWLYARRKAMSFGLLVERTCPRSTVQPNRGKIEEFPVSSQLIGPKHVFAERIPLIGIFRAAAGPVLMAGALVRSKYPEAQMVTRSRISRA